MPLSDDDDDVLSSLSSSKRYERADKGKKDALKRRIEKKMGAEKAAKADKASLLSKMGLKALKDKLAGKKDAETKRKNEEEQKAEEDGIAGGTKTLMQEEKAQMQTAQDRPDVDTMIERQEQEQDISDEETPMQPG